MQIRLNNCWWSELGFKELYLFDMSFDKFESLYKLYEYLSDGLNHIMDKLYDFCDMVEFDWYYNYWKTKQFEEMTNSLKKEIDKYNLKRYLNVDIDLPFDRIKEKLLNNCERYLADGFSERDTEEYKIKLGIA